MNLIRRRSLAKKKENGENEKRVTKRWKKNNLAEHFASPTNVFGEDIKKWVSRKPDQCCSAGQFFAMISDIFII